MFGQQPNRIQPAAPASLYKTYAIASPVDTHTRPGTCEEAECLAFQHGWVTRVDTSTELGKQQSEYVESKVHGRVYKQQEDGPIVAYRFLPGQQCFASPHRVALERPAFFIVRDGDHRGNPRGTAPVSRSVDDWVDDFANHQAALRDLQEKG